MNIILLPSFQTDAVRRKSGCNQGHLRRNEGGMNL